MSGENTSYTNDANSKTNPTNPAKFTDNVVNKPNADLEVMERRKLLVTDLATRQAQIQKVLAQEIGLSAVRMTSSLVDSYRALAKLPRPEKKKPL